MERTSLRKRDLREGGESEVGSKNFGHIGRGCRTSAKGEKKGVDSACITGKERAGGNLSGAILMRRKKGKRGTLLHMEREGERGGGKK